MKEGRLGKAALAGILLLLLLPILSAQAAGPVCGANAQTTFVKIDYLKNSDGSTGTDGVLSAYVYTITSGSNNQQSTNNRDRISNMAAAQKEWRLSASGSDGRFSAAENSYRLQVSDISPPSSGPSVKGVAGALLLVVSGPFIPNSAYDPKTPGANGVCYIVSNAKGNASATLASPEGGKCFNHRVVFCLFTNESSDLAACAGLVDTQGKAVKTLLLSQLVACPDAKGGKIEDVATARGGTKCTSASPSNSDLRDCYRPSQNSLQTCNNGPSNSQVGFCWMAALIFGLLFSASFLSGHNPLMPFDFGTGRGIRPSRGTPYTPMTQNVSINPVQIAMAADKAAGTLSDATGLTSSDGSGSKGLVGRYVNKGLDSVTGLTDKVSKKDSKVVTRTEAVDKAARKLLQAGIVGGLVAMVAMIVPGKKGGRGAAAFKAFKSAAAPMVVKAATGLASDAAKAGVMAGVEAVADRKDLGAAAAADRADHDSHTTTSSGVAASGLEVIAERLRDDLHATLPDITLRVEKNEKTGGLDIVGNNGIVYGQVAVATDAHGNAHHVEMTVRDGKSDQMLTCVAGAGGKVVWKGQDGHDVTTLIAGRMQQFESSSGLIKSYIFSVGSAILSGSLEAILNTLGLPITALWRPFTDTQGHDVANAEREMVVAGPDGKKQTLVIKDGEVRTLQVQSDGTRTLGNKVGTYDAKTGAITITNNTVPGLKAGNYIVDGPALREVKPLAGPAVEVGRSGGGGLVVDGNHIKFTSTDDGQTQAITDGKGKVLARIERDVDGHVVHMKDANGNETRSITVNGMTYELNVTPDTSSSHRADTLSISQNGAVVGAEVKAWTANFLDNATGTNVVHVDADGNRSERMTQAEFVKQTVVTPIFNDIDTAFAKLNDGLTGLIFGKGMASQNAPWQNFLQAPGSMAEVWIGAAASGVMSDAVQGQVGKDYSGQAMRARAVAEERQEEQKKINKLAEEAGGEEALRRLQDEAGEPERFDEDMREAENRNYKEYCKKVEEYQAQNGGTLDDAARRVGHYTPVTHYSEYKKKVEEYRAQNGGTLDQAAAAVGPYKKYEYETELVNQFNATLPVGAKPVVLRQGIDPMQAMFGAMSVQLAGNAVPGEHEIAGLMVMKKLTSYRAYTQMKEAMESQTLGEAQHRFWEIDPHKEQKKQIAITCAAIGLGVAGSMP